MTTESTQLGSFANFLHEKRSLMASNQNQDQTTQKGLKALSKMSYEEFEGLKLILRTLLEGGEIK